MLKGAVGITFHMVTDIPEGTEDPPKWLDEWIEAWAEEHDLSLDETTEIEAYVYEEDPEA